MLEVTLIAVTLLFLDQFCHPGIYVLSDLSSNVEKKFWYLLIATIFSGTYFFIRHHFLSYPVIIVIKKQNTVAHAKNLCHFINVDLPSFFAAHFFILTSSPEWTY